MSLRDDVIEALNPWESFIAGDGLPSARVKSGAELLDAMLDKLEEHTGDWRIEANIEDIITYDRTPTTLSPLLSVLREKP